jgi:hypothetical protein
VTECKAPSEKTRRRRRSQARSCRLFCKFRGEVPGYHDKSTNWCLVRQPLVYRITEPSCSFIQYSASLPKILRSRGSCTQSSMLPNAHILLVCSRSRTCLTLMASSKWKVINDQVFQRSDSPRLISYSHPPHLGYILYFPKLHQLHLRTKREREKEREGAPWQRYKSGGPKN